MLKIYGLGVYVAGNYNFRNNFLKDGWKSSDMCFNIREAAPCSTV